MALTKIQGKGVSGLDIDSSGNVGFTQTLQTEIATTSGTTHDFTIPSGVKKFTVMFDDVSLATASILMIRLGDSGGVETTGYEGCSSNDSGNTYSYSSYGNGFLVDTGASASAAHVIHGLFTFANINASDYTWIGAGNSTRGTDGAGHNNVSAGRKILSGELTTVQITSKDGETFDGGRVNILLEG